EPILALDLPLAWQEAFRRVYGELAAGGPRILLASYFDRITQNLDVLRGLPVHGVHVDLVRAPEQALEVAAVLGDAQVLSAGVIDGRNIWRTDLDDRLALLGPLREQLGGRLWLAPSCSLLHVPVDLGAETQLDPELKSWLSFAAQKLEELRWLARSLDGDVDEATAAALQAQRAALQSRRSSSRTHNEAVRRQLAESPALSRSRAPFAERIARQRKEL